MRHADLTRRLDALSKQFKQDSPGLSETFPDFDEATIATLADVARHAGCVAAERLGYERGKPWSRADEDLVNRVAVLAAEDYAAQVRAGDPTRPTYGNPELGEPPDDFGPIDALLERAGWKPAAS